MIPMFKPKISNEVVPAVLEVLQSGLIGEGDKVRLFKEQLEKRFNCKNLLPLNSCTSAITLAGRLLGLKSGDEVITTPFTMIATNVALMPYGVKLVWADIGRESINIDPSSVAAYISPKTKAIVVTNVGGVPCDFELLTPLKIPIISDCAHAIDATYKGKHISHMANFNCFSFQSIKQLTTGDGGALVMEEEMYERAERLKWFGMTRQIPEGMTKLEHQMSADVTEWGYKFHMNDLQAAIGLANLQILDKVTMVQRSNAFYYLKALAGLEGITLPYVPPNCNPSWWAFPLFVEDRDNFIKMLLSKGIETTPMWRRNDEYSTFQDSKKNYLPNMTLNQKKIIFIPVGWWVTLADRDFIADTITQGW